MKLSELNLGDEFQFKDQPFLYFVVTQKTETVICYISIIHKWDFAKTSIMPDWNYEVFNVNKNKPEFSKQGKPKIKQTINEFDALVKSLMNWLRQNYSPHTKIIIDSENAELLEGVLSSSVFDDDLEPKPDIVL